ITLDVLFTPGHAPGHVSYVLREERTVFSGDCLFYGNVGRTDLPGADYETLMRSITTRLLPLGDAFTVAPGHMRDTTIGYERRHNPFVVEYLDASAP
ncbi:MAG: MBL fold metallo-hydrolase, partial [Anaerolineae bacterium]|nr:MBL fold metallo-hydrolase [Anaerolineae bacterium]